MGDIYMSSYLTLSATRSRSSSEGCFAGTPSAKLTGIDSHGQTYEVYARRLINHFRFLTASKTDFLSYPLFERSWCYQERLLSPRILHFGPQELFFECLEDCKCECQWMQKIGSSFSSVPKRSHTNALLGRTVFDAQRRWYDIVSVYSALKLTRPSDRLPALSGIAKQVQDCGMGQYYAGLWEVTVLEDLLWSVSPENAADPRPLAWRAPSWSWASVDTAVGYGRRATVKERYAHAIDIKTSPASVDPTGAVHAGHIILKGQVAPVIVFGPSQEEQMYALRPLHGSGYVMLYPDSAKDIQNNQILYYMKILTYAPDHMLLLIMVRSDPITQTYTRVGISDAYLEDDQSWVEQVFCGSNERVVTIE
ncbi:MAG: hypothetical protein M1820_010287 [Bogoriella megaspora]|nr:MAG: hypothetical protein M1820_010287 [Bogoriella megaspora]